MFEGLRPVIAKAKEIVVVLQETVDGISEEGQDREYLRMEGRVGVPVNRDVEQQAFEFRPCDAALRELLGRQPQRLAIGSKRMIITE